MPVRRTTRTAVALLVVALLAVTALAAVAWPDGARPFMVRTGSMAPAHLPGDLVLVAPARSAPVPGDVITFRTGAGPVTHRVVGSSAGGLVTQGDANRTPDVSPVALDAVIGVVVRAVPRGGYVVHYLSQPAGVASVMTTALAVLLAWQVFFPPAPAAGSRSAATGQDDAEAAPAQARTARGAPAPALVLSALVLVAFAGLAAVQGVGTTGAYFTSSVPGSLTVQAACADGPGAPARCGPVR